VPFPISRDPPEGGTAQEGIGIGQGITIAFPISRDPPEGGTIKLSDYLRSDSLVSNF